MLSYQHAYHAGNAADVHKHAALAVMLDYLAAKPKPLTYLETHAGRGLYFLDAPEAARTGEAAAGIGRLEAAFPPGHPYRRALAAVRAAHGPAAYPGSPLVAAQLMRPGDRMHLAELHPQEVAALREAMAGRGADIRAEDGFAMARALLPPMPRRGLILIDPSWEVKTDYARLPGLIAALHRRWPVGVIVLWYPLLAGAPQAGLTAALHALALPGALRHEVAFPPARPGHGMTGSGLFVVNAPYGFRDEAGRLSALFARQAT